MPKLDGPKPEFLMLAHPHDAARHGWCGYYASEKLDGIRVMWDGGISRGLHCTEIPYANTAKDGRYKSPPIATGLWTRYGKALQAPDWWLDALPFMPLDGELEMGRNSWQRLSSVIKQLSPTEEWKDVHYAIFDSPNWNVLFKDRTINNRTFKKTFKDCHKWAAQRVELLQLNPCLPEQTFYKNLAYLKQRFLGKYASVHYQEQLTSVSAAAARSQAMKLFHKVLNQGGEGLILRSPISIWKPERSWTMLKLKPENDAEGMMIGYKWGKATDIAASVSGEATDRMVGLMGSMRLKLDSGVEFDLASGFTLEERLMSPSRITEEMIHPIRGNICGEIIYNNSVANQGQSVPDWVENPLFPRGSRITFSYRELTDSGVPKEARYKRLREVD